MVLNVKDEKANERWHGREDKELPPFSLGRKGQVFFVTTLLCHIEACFVLLFLLSPRSSSLLHSSHHSPLNFLLYISFLFFVGCIQRSSFCQARRSAMQKSLPQQSWLRIVRLISLHPALLPVPDKRRASTVNLLPVLLSYNPHFHSCLATTPLNAPGSVSQSTSILSTNSGRPLHDDRAPPRV